MPTETQKKFRKQMKKIEKELKDQNEKPFYSFIEREHISNYYEKNKKKRMIISSISIGGILLFIWNFYAISTWLNPIFNFATGKNISSISIFSSLTGNKHKEIADYLKQTKEIDLELKKFIEYVGQGSNNTFKTEDERDIYLDTLNIYEEKFKEKISTLENIKPPKELENHHTYTLQLLRYSLDMIFYTFNIVNSNDIESINQYNNLINKYNEQSHKRHLHLIKVFNEVKMKYKIMDDQTIEYMWEEI